jgi:peptide subunit release factor 1 (eRF1)
MHIMVSDSSLALLREYYSLDQNPVVSLYLDVDGSRFPSRADYEAGFSVLVSNFRKTLDNDRPMNRDQSTGLDSELKAISDFITLQFERNGVKGLAVFSCRAEDFWHVIPLNVNVKSELFIGSKPHIAPLMEIIDRHEEVCVMITNKETARIFQLNAGGIVEHPEIMDKVSGHHDQGGWKQDKLQRRHKWQVHDHLKRASAALLEYFKKEKFNRFMVGIADELWPDLEKVLHPYLKERLVGRFSVDINSQAKDILEKANLIQEQLKKKEDSSLLESLSPELTDGGVFVGGLDDVLALLNQRRVDLLLVERGFREKGKFCPSCDALVYSEETCPSCLRDMETINVVDEARELAVRQSARIITVPPGHPSLAQAGQIAARLRY